MKVNVANSKEVSGSRNGDLSTGTPFSGEIQKQGVEVLFLGMDAETGGSMAIVVSNSKDGNIKDFGFQWEGLNLQQYNLCCMT